MIQVTNEDIGREVIYCPAYFCALKLLGTLKPFEEYERGIIKSFNERYIFVKYGNNVKATLPIDLFFAEHSEQLKIMMSYTDFTLTQEAKIRYIGLQSIPFTIYVAQPYTNVIGSKTDRAIELTSLLVKKGYSCYFSPILNSHFTSERLIAQKVEIPYDYWMNVDLQIIRQLYPHTIIIFDEGFEVSKGCAIEWKLAQKLAILRLKASAFLNGKIELANLNTEPYFLSDKNETVI